jgi:drug/metabolite transporter (DMT)-like permease
MHRRILGTAQGTRPEAFGPADWGLLASVAVMWGSSFLLIAEGVEAFSPSVVALVRLACGAATLAALRQAPVQIDREDWPQVAALGLTWMALPMLLFPIAQQWVASSIAGMVNGGAPIFAGTIAALMLRRRPGRRQVAGLAVGFAGVVLITLPSALGAGGSPLGIGLLTIATMLYGVGLNLAVPLQQRYGSLPVLRRAQLVAILVVLPFGIAGLPSSTWSWRAALAVAALGAFGTGLAFVAMAVLVGRVGATRGSVAIYFVPAVAMLLGVVVRGEAIPPLAVAGIVLVVAGAWSSSRREP